MEKWVLKKDNCDVLSLSKKTGLPFYLAKLISNRNVTEREKVEIYLNGNLNDLHDPEFLPDVDIATDILMETIENNGKIRIIGDYDVDGVMSTYILYSLIKDLDANVDYRIPHRVEDGYGINIKLIEEAKEDGVSLIITCDNGISAFSEIDFAEESGISVIITDHHDIPFDENNSDIERIPNADAVINPKLRESLYPFSGLCGAGVAFKFMEYVYVSIGILDDDFYDYLQYVAIATICDVMLLADENRTIVKYGLKFLKETENFGLRALLEVSNLSGRELSSESIGFILGPILNSAGRLESSLIALELLLADQSDSNEKALLLKDINERRKVETERGVREALRVIDEENLSDDSVLVIYLKEVSESIIGIVAGRIKERFGKPTFILSKGNQTIKGSGRSVMGYDMYHALSQCGFLLEKYGGHEMAVGFSIQEENILTLRNHLKEKCLLSAETFIKTYRVDLRFPIFNLRESVVEQLEMLEPFGNGNEKPIFTDVNVMVTRMSIVGTKGNVIKLWFTNTNGFSMEGILFSRADEFLQMIDEKFGSGYMEDLKKGINNKLFLDILYLPTINFYRDNKTLQVNIISFRLAKSRE